MEIEKALLITFLENTKDGIDSSINEIKPNSNIYLIENFLSDIECDKIMKSEWDLKSGGVYSSDGNSYVDEYYRKCSALSIDIPTLKQKISKFIVMYR